MWKTILKRGSGKYGARNFKELKEALQRQLNNLPLETPTSVPELYENFAQFYTDKQPGFEQWFKWSGQQWLTSFTLKISRNMNNMEVVNISHGDDMAGRLLGVKRIEP